MNWPKYIMPEYSDGLIHLTDEFDPGEDGTTVYGMKQDIGSEYFWCAEHAELGSKYETDCGFLCPDYDPCNGKSGRCRHSKIPYIETGRKYRLTYDGLEPV